MEITSFFFYTLGREQFEIKTLQIRASLKSALPDIQILWLQHQRFSFCFLQQWIVSRLNLHQAGLDFKCKEEPEVIIWEMGILTKGFANKRAKLIDNGLIIFYTDLIIGDLMRRQLLAPSNLGKIAFIKLRMKGIR